MNPNSEEGGYAYKEHKHVVKPPKEMEDLPETTMLDTGQWGLISFTGVGKKSSNEANLTIAMAFFHNDQFMKSNRHFIFLKQCFNWVVELINI